MEKPRRVCVTGAGGYLASWVVKLLLSKGYMVHGTVRDPGKVKRISEMPNKLLELFSLRIIPVSLELLADEKNAHLKKLDDASQNLQLFKASLLDYNSLCEAIAGCSGVLHVASPCPAGSVPNPEASNPMIHSCYPTITDRHGLLAFIHSSIAAYGLIISVDLIEPAVTGTLNVLKACSEVGVKRVVVVSSGGAVVFTPHWPKDKAMDERCWSDEEYCRTSGNWYFLSKTLAEKAALQYGEKSGLHVVTVCPAVMFGPLLQSTVNATSLFLLKTLRGEQETVENRGLVIADVRDVADALIIAYEKPEASGRYICASHMIRMRDLVDKLRSLYPNYDYPKNFAETNNVMVLSAENLKSLGWKCRPLEETLVDNITSFQEAGLLCKL
ncbi:hypothetical protein ACLOJK_015654 [Asimina triloba]